MTTTKVIASKFTVALVATAMVFSVFASAAQAQTTEELQAMINDLLAQVAALSGSTGDSMTSACSYTWTRSLNVGSEGADVKMLQEYLNMDADTQVSLSGAGAPGAETMYYGPATAAAVSKFQVKYRADILSPVNLVNPTGFFGPSTMTKANSLCAAGEAMEEGEESEEGSEEEEEETGSMTLSGEASLEDMEIDSASDDEIQEGSEDVEIGELTLEFSDGDAEVSRIDLTLSNQGGGDDVWDIFETISLWVDGDKVAEENADDEDDYKDTTGTDGELRFSGLDLIFEEDDSVDITIAATIQDSIDTADLGDYGVQVDSLRFFDADGVAETESTGFDFGTVVTVDIQEEGQDDELIAKTSSNDPDSDTLQVEDDKKSDWYNVFTFDLDTDDSENDIELDTIVLTVDTVGGTYDTLVDDAEITIDGTEIDDVVVTNGGSNTATLTFDVDGDVVINAGDRVEAQLMLRFKSLAPANEGDTVAGSIAALTTLVVDAEGADDLDNTQLSGSATGDAHTLRTTGIDTELTDDSAVVTTGDNATDDYGTYTLEVEVTAFEQDVFIDTDPAVSTSYSLVDGAGVAAVAGSQSVTLSSSADENGGYFEINEGETETLTLTVTYTPGVANTAARLVIDDISFAATAVAPTQTQTTLPATDYRTDVITMVN